MCTVAIILSCLWIQAGCLITLVGSEDETQRFFVKLQALTNDELSYDKEIGVVTIVNTGIMNMDKFVVRNNITGETLFMGRYAYAKL